jgi:hypothetical protein
VTLASRLRMETRLREEWPSSGLRPRRRTMLRNNARGLVPPFGGSHRYHEIRWTCHPSAKTDEAQKRAGVAASAPDPKGNRRCDPPSEDEISQEHGRR